jgi:hypothetical protein
MHVQDQRVRRIAVLDVTRDLAAEAHDHADPDQRDIDDDKRTVGRMGGRERAALG